MDVNTHVRAVWRHRWVVLLGALAIALVVLLLRSLPATAYTTSASLSLTPGAETSAADVTRLTDVYAELEDKASVLEATVVALADPAVDAELVRRATGVSAVSDGLLQVTGVAPTAEAAAALTNAYGEALARAVALDQQRSQRRTLEPLDAQLAQVNTELGQLVDGDPGFGALQEQRSALVASRADLLASSLPQLDLLTLAQPREADRAPRAVRDALLAFLVALIVLSELVVLRAVRQGRLDGIGVAEALEQLSGLPVLRIGRTGGSGDQSAALLALVLAGEASAGAPVVTKLLPLDPTPAAQAAPFLLSEAAQRAGRQVVIVDAEGTVQAGQPDRPGLRRLSLPPNQLAAQSRAGRLEQTGPDDVVLVTLSSWDAPELLAVGPLPGTAVLVVDARSVRAGSVEEALKVLRLAATPAELVVLVDLGRKRARRLLHAASDQAQPAQPSPAEPTAARS